MSFKGQIEAKCPRNCEPFLTEVWTFIRGDQSPELRDAVLWRECNLILCEECNVPFFPEVSYVYFEPPSELLAFVFPESFRKEEAKWRAKMKEDFLTFKNTLGKELKDVAEPEIFFGLEGLPEELEREDFRGEEREVMEHYAKDLNLKLYRVSPSYSRRQGVPRSLPYDGKSATPATIQAGLEKVIAANDRLEEYKLYLKRLKTDKSEGLPPAA